MSYCGQKQRFRIAYFYYNDDIVGLASNDDLITIYFTIIG